MAQIGGFYSFLKFVIGGIMSSISHRIMIMSIINSLRDGKKDQLIQIKRKIPKNRKIAPIVKSEKSSSRKVNILVFY